MGVLDEGLNLPASQDVLTATLQSVSIGSVLTEEALLRIQYWLNSGKLRAVETELTNQYQFV